jgi:hypothetical protein
MSSSLHPEGARSCGSNFLTAASSALAGKELSPLSPH